MENKFLDNSGLTYFNGKIQAQLNNKVDIESGKGLSTYDFTKPYKDKLDKAVEQSGNRNLSGIFDPKSNYGADLGTTNYRFNNLYARYINGSILGDAAYKGVDSELNSTSTNLLQNKAIQAPIARLVDTVVTKNLLNFENLSKAGGPAIVSKDSDSITATSVTSGGAWTNVAYTLPILPSGTYTFSAYISAYSCSGGSVRIIIAKTVGGQNQVGGVTFTGVGNVNFEFNSTGEQLYILYYPNYSSSGNNNSFTALQNMICTSEDYAISPTFALYAPSNRELYERFKVVNKTIYLQNKTFSKSTSGSYYLPEASATTVSELTTICSIVISGTAYLKNEYVLVPRTVGSANKVGFTLSYITSGTLPNSITISENLTIDLCIFGIT